MALEEKSVTGELRSQLWKELATKPEIRIFSPEDGASHGCALPLKVFERSLFMLLKIMEFIFLRLLLAQVKGRPHQVRFMRWMCQMNGQQEWFV